MVSDVLLNELGAYHRAALDLARNARLAAGDLRQAGIVWSAARNAFETHIEPGMRDLERVLLPALVDRGCTDAVERALADHHDLREAAITDSDPSGSLLDLADALVTHVQASRDLLELAERRLRPEDLASLAHSYRGPSHPR